MGFVEWQIFTEEIEISLSLLLADTAPDSEVEWIELVRFSGSSENG